MANDSSTGGYLVPSSPAPIEDAALEDVIQGIVVGITGLPGTMVRPRWQPTPPKQPPPATNWCAIGITRTYGETYAYIGHSGVGNGSDTLQRHYSLDLLASFYGPSGQLYAGLFRDGLLIEQNREVMAANGMALYEAREIIAAPELTNTQWIRRFDVPFTLRRQVNRTYPVLNLLSAEGTIHAETETHVNENDWIVQEN